MYSHTAIYLEAMDMMEKQISKQLILNPKELIHFDSYKAEITIIEGAMHFSSQSMEVPIR